MHKTLHRVDRVFQATLAAGVVAAFLVMLVCIGLQVVMRYVFNSPLVWSEELARFAMIWMAFLAIALGLRRGSHVRLEGLKVVPKRWNSAVGWVSAAVVAALLGMLVYYGWTLTERTMTQISAALQLPMGLIYAAIPVSALLMLLGLLLRRLASDGKPASGTGSGQDGQRSGPA
jgi:TRAP-type C4-dicarboxylate transport system permease small subunit